MTDTRWVSANITVDSFDQLYELASDRGMKTSELAADLIEEGLAREAEGHKTPEARAFALAYRARKDEQLTQHLERIAWFAVHKSDESLVDQLEVLCEETGRSVMELMEKAETMDAPPILVGRDTTGRNAAMRWLQDRFNEHKTWPVPEIRDLASRAGFSDSTLSRAKRELGIASQREAAYWTWTTDIIDIEEEQQEQQHPNM